MSQVIYSYLPAVSFSDIDECHTLLPRPCSCGVPGEPCGANCVNLVPGYKCTCAPGFQLRSGGTICDGNFENNLLLICQLGENWRWLAQGVHVKMLKVSIQINGIRLDRSMVRSLQVRSLHTEVRLLHSKVSSLHQISYFAPCRNLIH